MLGMLDALSGPIDDANAEVVGETLVDLDGDRAVVRRRAQRGEDAGHVAACIPRLAASTSEVFRGRRDI